MSEETKLTPEKEIKLEEVQKKVSELLNMSEIEELIKVNEKVFEYEGSTYRVRKPSFKQKQEAYTKRVEKFTELLQNNNYLLENDLKTNYKKRGIDIDSINQDIENKAKRRESIMISLGEAIKKNSPEVDLLAYKKEIELINEEIQNLSFKRINLLEFSIENQVLIYMYSYLTFLVAEKKDGENWIKVWNTWEDFQCGDGRLANKFSYYTTIMNSSQEF